MQWTNNLPHPAAALAHREWASRERDAGGFSGVGGIGGMGGGGSGVLHGSFNTVQASRVHRGSPSRPWSAPLGPQWDRLSGMVRMVPMPRGDRSRYHDQHWKADEASSSSAPIPVEGRPSRSPNTTRRGAVSNGERTPESPTMPPSRVNKGRLRRGTSTSPKSPLRDTAAALGETWHIADHRQSLRSVEVGFTTSQRVGYTSPAPVFRTYAAMVPSLGVNGHTIAGVDKPETLVYLGNDRTLQQSSLRRGLKTSTPAVWLTHPGVLIGAARSSTGAGGRASDGSNLAAYDLTRSFASPRGASFGARRNPPQTAAFALNHDNTPRSITSPAAATSVLHHYSSTSPGQKTEGPKTKGKCCLHPHSAAQPIYASARVDCSPREQRQPTYVAYIPHSHSPHAVKWRLPHHAISAIHIPQPLAVEVVGIPPATSPRPHHRSGAGEESLLEEHPAAWNMEAEEGKQEQEGMAAAAVQFHGLEQVWGEECSEGLVESELVGLDTEHRNTPGIYTGEENGAGLMHGLIPEAGTSRAEGEVTTADVGVMMAADEVLDARDMKCGTLIPTRTIHIDRCTRNGVSALEAENAAAQTASQDDAVDEMDTLVRAAVEQNTTRMEADFVSRISQLQLQVSQVEERARSAESRAAGLAAQIAGCAEMVM